MLCFRYTDRIPLLSKSKIPLLSKSKASVLVQPGLCRTCSETTLLVFPRGGSFISCHIFRGKDELTVPDVDDMPDDETLVPYQVWLLDIF